MKSAKYSFDLFTMKINGFVLFCLLGDTDTAPGIF